MMDRARRPSEAKDERNESMMESTDQGSRWAAPCCFCTNSLMASGRPSRGVDYARCAAALVGLLVLASSATAAWIRVDSTSFEAQGDSVTVEIGELRNTSESRATNTLYVSLRYTQCDSPRSYGFGAFTTEDNDHAGLYSLDRAVEGGDSRLGPGESWRDIRITTGFRRTPSGTWRRHLVVYQYNEELPRNGATTQIGSATYSGTRYVSGGDGDDSCFTATRVDPDGERSSTIASRSDADYYRIDVPSWGELVVETTGNLDTAGDLLDGTGVRIAEDHDGAGAFNFRIARTVDAGTYYVRVVGQSDATGSYTLRVRHEEMDAYDSDNDTRAGAVLMDVGSDVRGAVDYATDVDWWRFDLPSRGTVVISTAGSVDTVGRLANTAGDLVAEDDNSGDDGNFRIERALEPGVWYVRVAGNSDDDTGDYTLSLSFESEALSPTLQRISRLGDFDGDGRADVLLQRDDGFWYYYAMDGRRHISERSGAATLTRNLRYDLAGVGDFDGDDRDDVILRRDDGAWYYYAMDGRRHIAEQSGPASLTRNLRYNLVGIGDFDGDGRDDVLLRRDDGAWYYYAMDGRRHISGRNGPANLTRDLRYDLAGIGDFDGDGRDDVLLRRDDGLWYYYAMDGRRHIGEQSGSATLTRKLEYGVVGVGDFDGDGSDDVLLRRDDGAWYYYAMDGRRHVSERSGGSTLTRKLQYRPAGVGDLDGDGRDDVLLRRNDGLWYYYAMGGRRHISGQNGAATPTRNLRYVVAGTPDPVSHDGDDTRSSASDLTIGTAGNGTLNGPNDVDYWRIEVPSSGRVVIETTGDTDTTGQLEDASGNRIAGDDHGGAGKQFQDRARCRGWHILCPRIRDEWRNGRL